MSEPLVVVVYNHQAGHRANHHTHHGPFEALSSHHLPKIKQNLVSFPKSLNATEKKWKNCLPSSFPRCICCSRTNEPLWIWKCLATPKADSRMDMDDFFSAVWAWRTYRRNHNARLLQQLRWSDAQKIPCDDRTIVFPCGTDSWQLLSRAFDLMTFFQSFICKPKRDRCVDNWIPYIDHTICDLKIPFVNGWFIQIFISLPPQQSQAIYNKIHK